MISGAKRSGATRHADRKSTGTATVAAAAFGVVAVVHLVAQLAGAGTVDRISQYLLMPLLAATLALSTDAPRSRLVRTTLLALGFSWLGDSAPSFFDGDTAFLVMIGFFLLAQIAYIVAFWPYRSRALATRPALAACAVAIVLLVVACAPGAGVLLAPALVYGLCLGSMAVLATGLGRIAAWGGALFLLSDSMIALGAFADWFNPPAKGFWVMLTYIAGQTLLVAGVLSVDRAARAITPPDGDVGAGATTSSGR
ncbi:lysoplasmalogenase [Rhodococcus sp. NPDC003348]